MRLRLRIERNALPATQALWPVKDTKTTIAQLLQSVNNVFPLEAETWGLEDYTVSVDGYECLHWYEIRAACKEEDEVVIKPLQYVDVRSRTLTGRDQIAPDGRHLMDGVPFGRPQLKEPVRPEIRIPPRKKRKLNLLQNGHGEDDDDDDDDEEGAPLMLTENGEDIDEDEEDDGDFDEDDSASSDDSADSSVDSSSDGTSESDSGSDSDSESDDDGSWEGIPASEPATPSRKTDVPSQTSSTSNTTSAKRSSLKKSKSEIELDRIQRELSEMEAADAEEDERKRLKRDKKRKRGQEHTATSISEKGSNKKAKQTSGNELLDDADLNSAEQTPRTVGIPFSGKLETKKRNERRRDSKKLKHLIRTGDLPPDATLAAVRQSNDDNANSHYKGTNATAAETPIVDDMSEESTSLVNKKVDKAKSDPSFEASRQKLLSDIASGGVEVASEPSKKRKKKRADDEAAVIESLLRSHDDDEPPSEEETSKLSASTIRPDITSSGHNTASEATPDEAIDMPATSTTPRSRLNLDASRRLVFGSLGVRTPKTQEEKDELQKKLADRASRKLQMPIDAEVTVNDPLSADVEIQGATEEDAEWEDVDDDQGWRSRINLTAVECCDENVTLSTPPFPFHQRWDPQYRKKKAKKRVNGTYMEGSGQKRKRGRQGQDYVETYDKYNVNGDGDALDYDEAWEDEDEEYWDEGALLNGESEYEEVDSEKDDGRFPPLPKELGHLRILEEGDANQGDFIAFAELACDESTGWQPKEITRLAQVLSTSTDGSCWIQLRPQDLKQKVFDEDGNRIYSKFEMPEAEDHENEEDDGTRTIPWKEMRSVRLVMRPEEITKSLNLTGI